MIVTCRNAHCIEMAIFELEDPLNDNQLLLDAILVMAMRMAKLVSTPTAIYKL